MMKQKWMRIALPLAVLGLGVAGMAAINATTNENTEKEVVDTRPTVRVNEISSQDYQVVINSYGEVIPLEKTQLAALVSGEVVDWHPDFIPGGLVKRGTVLFSIDKEKYEAALLQAEAELKQAKAQLIEEQARAEVAKREASSMPDSQVTDLYLRKPQVLSAEAAVKSAEARHKIAKRDLQYCEVKAPYDALVISRELGQGQYVNVGSQVAELYNIEIAEVMLPIAGFDSAFLPADLEGNEATITSRGVQTVSRQAIIDRDLGVVDVETRMSQIVARIQDPYSLNTDAPKFKFGSYVEVTLPGRTLNEVYRLPQELVTNRTVWVVDQDNQLAAKKVEVLREEGEFFLISNGLSNGDQVVMTLPEYPQKGMKVKVASETKGEAKTETEELVAQTGI